MDAHILVMRINGTYGDQYPRKTCRGCWSSIWEYSWYVLWVCFCLFLLKLGLWEFWRKQYNEHYAQDQRENSLLNCILDVSEHSGMIPKIYLAFAGSFVPRWIWGWQLFNYAWCREKAVSIRLHLLLLSLSHGPRVSKGIRSPSHGGIIPPGRTRDERKEWWPLLSPPILRHGCVRSLMTELYCSCGYVRGWIWSSGF